MNKIKFSYPYKKLFPVWCNTSISNDPVPRDYIPRSAKLLEVINVKMEDLSETFLEYDTDGVFTLPKKGNYMLLLFMGDTGHLFTTIRRQTESKETYYRSQIGKWIIVELKENGGLS